ncbi:MAG: HNH endonuclease [Alphaproteobacteria bacterium]|nr:HNH endonuclease [Alphaproteobacteria bacterium]
MHDDVAARSFLRDLHSLRTWSREGVRAPHKPLVLLTALGRISRGEPRLARYGEVEPLLKELLDDFGPARASQAPHRSFWRLATDGDLWEVPARDGHSTPPMDAMRKVEGGFPEPVDRLLRRRPDLVADAALLLLVEHFPSSYHADLMDAVGLTAPLLDADTQRPIEDDPLRWARSHRRQHDRAFRQRVLIAHAHRCAVCGWDAHLVSRRRGVVSVGAVLLEATHVRWSSHDGPDTVDNGLALCVLHRKAFDRGLVALDSKHCILISPRLAGGDAVTDALKRHAGQPIGGPGVDPDHALWHREQVFKDR